MMHHSLDINESQKRSGHESIYRKTHSDLMLKCQNKATNQKVVLNQNRTTAGKQANKKRNKAKDFVLQ